MIEANVGIASALRNMVNQNTFVNLVTFGRLNKQIITDNMQMQSKQAPAKSAAGSSGQAKQKRMSRAEWLKTRPAVDKYGRPWLPEDVVQQFRADNEKRRKLLTQEHEELKKLHQKYQPPSFSSSMFNYEGGYYGNLDPIDITDK